jgi:hypothetical protein
MNIIATQPEEKKRQDRRHDRRILSTDLVLSWRSGERSRKVLLMQKLSLHFIDITAFAILMQVATLL